MTMFSLNWDIVVHLYPFPNSINKKDKYQHDFLFDQMVFGKFNEIILRDFILCLMFHFSENVFACICNQERETQECHEKLHIWGKSRR
jgi:hypothetical protein